MNLNSAIEKANGLQYLVGTILKEGGLRVEAVIVAPIEDNLFINFVMAVKDSIVEGRNPIPYDLIAAAIGGKNYDVYILYDGTLHPNYLERSGDILYEIYTD